jgi:hypothetical protein
MATIYKIHPAIGIARVGNSPDAFFIGPERPFERPRPAGGFKDDACRVKRQAARFRVFAHHDDGTVDEITSAQADIEWTVHVANKKAAHPERGNSETATQLTIDPGARTLTGPNQRAVFDGGKIQFDGVSAVEVPLGDMRTDDEGRLLVLGGAGKSESPNGTGIGDFWANEDWYDDVSDGPVSAKITLHGSGASHPCVGAWVIVTPPKFAPHQDSPTTLYDRVLQAMIDGGHATSPTQTLYSADVYPILQRARDIRWVVNVPGWSHTWPDPVTSASQRAAIFARLTAPTGGVADMPALTGTDAQLTATQYAHMQRWKDGAYVNDWVGVPAVGALTPDGIDRAALDACVGAAFYPGIEAGGRDASERPILDPALYHDAFRLNHDVAKPGDITATMALPWQADFYACDASWWPVPRPNDTRKQGQTTSTSWTGTTVTSYADMVAHWHKLGFVVDQGASKVEVERCETPSITLLTPHLDFGDVPTGPMGMVREVALPIVFEVIAPSAAVNFAYAPGGAPTHPQLVAVTTALPAGPTAPLAVATARLWLVYRTGAAPSSIPTQTLTVRETTTGQQWSVTVDASSVARKTTATALVLDRSGSMKDDRGDGQSKHASLQQAASMFVGLMLDGDGVGLVRYNQDAQVLHAVHRLGAGGLTDTNRSATLGLILGNQLDPSGQTSIGDGLDEGRALLSAASSYDQRALVVLTDGNENRAKWIADVADAIDARTFAVGLGTPQNTSAVALHTLSGNHGGYLLITGAIAQENQFVLHKHFLQILSGINQAEIVLDPQGELTPGRVERVPFEVTEADTGIEVVLLTPRPDLVDFRLQTPQGQLLEPWRAASEPTMRWIQGEGVACFRLALPVQLDPGRFSQAGTWHVLLRLGAPRLKPSEGARDGVDRSLLHRADVGRPVSARPRRENERAYAVAAAHAAQEATATALKRARLPYSVVVHAWSSVSLKARLEQDGFEPGATVTVRATVRAAGVPMPACAARAWAEVTGPDGQIEVPLERDGDGWTGRFTASAPGVWATRVRARGMTGAGHAFTREATLTAGVWRGGDRVVPPRTPDGGAEPPAVDDEALARCLKRLCARLDDAGC